jgi:2-C-methyl-D-erythritol 2,4-cyclodiphosphate synthase
MRIGFGYDVHRLEVGRPLILGGVEIPFDKGLDGHSDADVLVHAVMDALLGAAGLPDIGNRFPNTDEKWRGADSVAMLTDVVDGIRQLGLRVGNVDATLVAEAPKISPHVDAMKERLAPVLGVSIDRIAIKATTNEGMGFVGRGEGMCAYAAALLVAVDT